MAAPNATASLGLNLNSISLLKYFDNISLILGIKVDPPTNNISSILFLFILLSNKILLTISIHFLNKSLHKYSKSTLNIIFLKLIPLYKFSISINVS